VGAIELVGVKVTEQDDADRDAPNAGAMKVAIVATRATVVESGMLQDNKQERDIEGR